MPSPLLPWEVIERVIGHSGDDFETLLNFSLTCRDLRPRTLCILVADVHFKSRDQIFDFCDFLQANPHLKTLVCSIAVKPGDFAPFPLLSILPNLSKLKFYPPPNTRQQDRKAVTVMNRSTVSCCKSLGTNIQALHLSQLSFPTLLEFARLLLTFTDLKDLCCSRVLIRAKGNQAHVNVIKQRMSNRLHLSTLEIDFFDIFTRRRGELSVATLFLDASVVHSTVETLTMHGPRMLHGLLHSASWPRLRTVVLKPQLSDGFISSESEDVPVIIAALKGFHSSTLKNVTVELRSVSIQVVNLRLLAKSRLYLELEQTLLRFPRPKVTILVDHLRLGRSLLWTQEIGKRFPVLFQRGAFNVTSKTVISRAGHDGPVRNLATSPDGKWVATGSEDSTIILWDAADGSLVQQWVAHSYKWVTSLAFSPDGRVLASGGGYSSLKIWDVAVGSREVNVLKEHNNSVVSSAWSPHGEMIASGSSDESVRLWDPRTFRELHALNPASEHLDASSRNSIQLVVFSPDGSWLVSGSHGTYDIWNVASSTMHKSLPANLNSDVLPVAAFSPGGTRLLVAARDEVKLMDVETKKELVVWRGSKNITDVAFSPDGTLFLSASDDGVVKLWDADTSAETFTLEGHKMAINRTCFSPCGEYVASASRDSTVRLWRTKDGSCVATFFDHNSTQVLRVAFCPDGETLWSGDEDGTVVMRRMRDIVPSNEQACSVAHTYLV